mmetsp:Transcript_19495/g.27368  ORF Transcript_19495/g.27368 Transcript_19495/m.27368 type:complete len:121 (-) Transcript_19495:64-426(-)
MSSERSTYIIMGIDDPSGGPMEPPLEPRNGGIKRISNYTLHKEYQAKTSDTSSDCYINKIAAGPMVSDDGKFMIGSFFIVEGGRDDVERFYKNDPFFTKNVWKNVTCERYISVQGIKAYP